MQTSAMQRAIAASKLSYMEKYGFAYEEDLALLKNCLDASIQYSADGRAARVICQGLDLTVEVKPGGDKTIDSKSWKTWKKS